MCNFSHSQQKGVKYYEIVEKAKVKALAYTF